MNEIAVEIDQFFAELPLYVVKLADGMRIEGRKMLALNWRIYLVDTSLGFPDVVDQWCYASVEPMLKAMREWDGIGEPDGWIRHPTSGRRRPDGTASTEYVNP